MATSEHIQQSDQSTRGLVEASTSGTSRRRSPSTASSSATSQYDGPLDDQWQVGSAYDYLNADSVSDWIKCAICLGPFYEPWAATSSCSHTFCKYCIQEHHRSILKDSQVKFHDDPMPCPSCRTLNRLTSYQAAQPLIRNLVDSLKVYCPIRSRGCDWVGERESVAHHLTRDCGFTWIGEFDLDEEHDSVENITATASSSRGEMHRRKKARCECGARVMRKDWEEHCTMGCIVDWQRCEHCNNLVRHSEGAEPHVETCEAVPINCQYCSEMIERGSLSRHHDESCGEVPMQCTMARFGCPWKGTRASLGASGGAHGPMQEHAHLLSCAFVPLATYLEASDRRLHELEQENIALKREVLRNRAVEEANEAVLRSCVDALGPWYRQDRGEINRGRSESRPSTSSDPLARGSSHDPHDSDIGWPPTTEGTSGPPTWHVSDPTPDTASRPLSSFSSTSVQPREPSRLEATLNELTSSLSTLSAHSASLTNHLHDSRRESIYASVEVTRLAEEVGNLRHGLHQVARQLQVRQSSWRSGVWGFGIGSSSANAEAAQSTSNSVGSSAPQQQNSSTSPGPQGISDAQVGGVPQGMRPSTDALLGLSSASIPMLPTGHPLAHLPYYPGHQSHHLPYPPALPMPMPGVRRFWSGFEQTKL